MGLTERLKENPMNSPLRFIGRLFELRDAAHIEHLKTRSFAAPRPVVDVSASLV